MSGPFSLAYFLLVYLLHLFFCTGIDMVGQHVRRYNPRTCNLQLNRASFYRLTPAQMDAILFRDKPGLTNNIYA